MIADGANRQVAFIKESAAGTTPSSPVWLIARTITAPYVIDIPYIKSRERRADGRTGQIYKGNGTTSCNPTIEWADDGVIDAYLESLLCSTFNSSGVMKDGVTPLTLSGEFKDELGATDLYARIRGLQAMSMSINWAPGEAVTSQIAMLGMDGDYDDAILSGATYTAAGTEKVFCGTDVTLTDIFGLSLKVQSLNLNISRNGGPRHAINASTGAFPFSVRPGQFDVTGEVVAYLENDDIPVAALAGTEGDVQLTFGVDNNKKYSLDMMTCNIIGHRIEDAGNTGDIMARFTFLARHDASDASQLKVTRNVA